MRVERIDVHAAELTYAGEAYAFAGGRSYRHFTSTVVTVHTDCGLAGHGEVCPCGPAYMPAFAEGLPACLRQLAPAVIGSDPRHLSVMTQRMNAALNGHGYAKAAIDLACWDLLGKVTGQPVHVLLGGRQQESLPLHRIVPLAPPEAMRDIIAGFRRQGFGHFQIKLGHTIEEDVALLRAIADGFGPGEIRVGDANGAWRRDEALRFSRAVRDLDIYLEQPCATYDECRAVRRRSAHPVKLDESLECPADVRRAIADDAMDAAALKVSKFGGLTPASVIRDLCVDAGIALTIEDAWGSGIATAAYAHLAMSTPADCLLNTTDLHNYNTIQLAHGAPETSGGEMRLGDAPGLGVEPDFETLGEPLLVLDRDS